MKVLLKKDVLNKIQEDLKMTDQEFADYIGVSRSQLWRANMSPKDKRFSLGNEFVASVLSTFQEKKFEDLFFLGSVSHECYKEEVI